MVGNPGTPCNNLNTKLMKIQAPRISIANYLANWPYIVFINKSKLFYYIYPPRCYMSLKSYTQFVLLYIRNFKLDFDNIKMEVGLLMLSETKKIQKYSILSLSFAVCKLPAMKKCHVYYSVQCIILCYNMGNVKRQSYRMNSLVLVLNIL